jgi:hypothetical protein
MDNPVQRSDTTGMTGSTGTMDSPVDNATYNVLMALSSKLEAIDTYRKYEKDDGSIWQELIREDRRHAERLLEELKSMLRR